MTAQRKEGDEGARRQVKRAALSSIGRLHIFRLTVGPFAVLVLITDGVGTLPSIRSGALGPEASDAGWRPLLPAHRVSRIRCIGTDVARSPARRPTPRARLAPAPGRGQHDLDSGRSRFPRWNNPYGGARRRRAADALRRGPCEEVTPLTLGLVAGIGGNGDCPHECIEWLLDHGVDVRGLMPTPRMPTPRAWQITERDGRRTQVWRLDERRSDELYAMLRPAHSSWPENAQKTRCAHFGVNP